MNIKNFLSLSLILSGGLIPFTQADNVLEEIIVTAERKETNLQSTPVVVSALTEEAIERLNAVEATELQNSIPGLTMVQGIAAPGKVDLYLRGAGDQVGAIILSESGVGVYIDDVYMPRLSVANIELLELERVEVLRGPQGTLYGRNSMGGAIKYISKKPDGSREGNFGVSYGSFDAYNLHGHFQTPIVEERIAASITASYRQSGDWYKNITLDEDRGNREVLAVNAKLEWIAEGPWSASFAVTYAEEQNDGGEFVARDPDTLKSITGDFRDVQSPLDAFGENDQIRTSFDFSYDFDSGLIFRSITAYQDLNEASSFDLTGQGLFNRVLASEVEVINQELQLRGNAFNQNLDWLIGGYFFLEDGNQTINDTIFGTARPATVIDVETTSYAFYAEGTYQFNDRFSFTGGLRYIDDKKDLSGAHRGIAGSAVNESNDVTARFVLDYQWTDNTFVFLNISKGYKAGSFNALATSVDDFTNGFDPETVWAYEVGVKSDSLESRLRTNVNVFFNSFSDLQGLHTTADGITTVDNIADANVYGVELEATWLASGRFELFGTVARQWNSYSNIDATSDVLSDFEVNRISEWFASLGFEYRVPLPNSKGALGLTGLYSYRSEYYNDIVNIPAVLTDDYTLLDIGGFYESADGHWRITLAGKNILDEEVYLKGLALIRTTGIPNTPPTWSLNFRYSF